MYPLFRFAFTSPVLKSIEFAITTSIGLEGPPGESLVPLGLLIRNSPALERISLRECLVSWESPPPSHSLRFMEVSTHFQTTIGDRSAMFLGATSASEFLLSTPMLEALTIIYDFPTKYHEATRRDDRIELFFLRELVLGEVDGPWCSYFFGRIMFPTTSRVELKFGPQYDGSEGQDLIHSYLRQRFQDPGKASGYLALLQGRLHIHATSTASVLLNSELEGSTQPIQDTPDADCRPIDLCFQDNYQRDWGISSSAACLSLPPQFVHTLNIEIYHIYFWAIIAHFSYITTITMNVNYLLSLLSHILAGEYPNLTSVKLRGISAHRWKIQCGYDDRILSWLRTRKKGGVPIRRLILDSELPVAWIKAAGRVVEHVEIKQQEDSFLY